MLYAAPGLPVPTYSPTKPYWGALTQVCPWIIFLPGLPFRKFFYLKLPSSRTFGFKTGIFMYHFVNVVQSFCPGPLGSGSHGCDLESRAGPGQS